MPRIVNVIKILPKFKICDKKNIENIRNPCHNCGRKRNNTRGCLLCNQCALLYLGLLQPEIIKELVPYKNTHKMMYNIQLTLVPVEIVAQLTKSREESNNENSNNNNNNNNNNNDNVDEIVNDNVDDNIVNK